MRASSSSKRKSAVSEGLPARVGLALATWSERWFPDPMVIALLGVVLVFVLGILSGVSPARLAFEGGKSFWALVPFTMQMIMVIVCGHVVASTPLVCGTIERLARVPGSPRQAVAWVALFSMLTSLISWGLSLIFSGLLVREIARRMKGLDYRAAGAAAYLGLGVVWAMGLSSSAAMLMATKAAMPASLFEISGVIPLSQTIFLWRSIGATAILIAVSVSVAYLSAPSAENARTAEDYNIPLASAPDKTGRATTPGEWLEYSPLLTVLVAGLLVIYLVEIFRTSPNGAARSTGPKHVQPDLFGDGPAPALETRSFFAERCREHSLYRRCANSISLLRHDSGNDCRYRAQRKARQLILIGYIAQHLCSGSCGLFGPSGNLHSFWRKQVGD